MHPQFGPFLRKKEVPVGGAKMEWKLAKKKDLPALEHFAISAGASFPLLPAHPTGWQLVIFNKNPRKIRHDLRSLIARLATRKQEYSSARVLTIFGEGGVSTQGISFRSGPARDQFLAEFAGLYPRGRSVVERSRPERSTPSKFVSRRIVVFKTAP